MVAMMVTYHDRWRMHDDTGGAWWLMVLLMVLLVVAVVVVIVLLLRGASGLNQPRPPGGGAGTGAGSNVDVDARAILRDRFARGDIDEDDFRARMRALDDTGG